MSGARLPSDSCSETLRVQCREDGAGRRKSGPTAYRTDTRVFGIAGDWKTTALEAEVWVGTVTDGRRRFMATCRK